MNSEPGGSAAFTPPYLQSPVAIHSRRFADTTTSDTHSSPAGLPRRPSDGLRFDAGGLQRRQIPSPLVFSPETSLHPSSGPTSLMDAGMDTGFNSMSFIRKHVFRRLKLAKGDCDRQLQRVSGSIQGYFEQKLKESEHEREAEREYRAQEREVERERGRVRGETAHNSAENWSETYMFQPGDLRSALQSDDGASESGLDYETERSSRHSRQPSRHSTSTESSSPVPIRRQQVPSGAEGSSRRRNDVVVGSPPSTSLNAHASLAARRLSRTIHVPMRPPPSGQTSRSTSRSRSPLPPLPPPSHAGSVTEAHIERSSSERGTHSPSSNRRSRILVDDPVDPIMNVLYALIGVATDVLEMSVAQLTAKPKACEDIVQRVQAIGKAWDDHPDWHGRNWYVQVLLAIASLSRVVEWWQAEQSFWNFNQDGGEEDEPLQFVTKILDEDDASTTPPLPEVTPIAPEQAGDSRDSNALRLLSPEDESRLRLSRPPSSGKRSRDEKDVTQALQDKEQEISRMSKPVDTVESARVLATERLRLQAETAQNRNIVMELSLDGEHFIWVNYAWQYIVGTEPEELPGSRISRFLHPDHWNVFREATLLLQEDDSHTIEVKFQIRTDSDDVISSPRFQLMEGKGMLMIDREDGHPSHTMWVIKPAVSAETAESQTPPTDLPDESVGEQLADAAETPDGISSTRDPLDRASSLPASRPVNTTPILCRICECAIPQWYFERHNETCVETHRLEAEVMDCNESIGELRSTIRELIALIERSSPAATPEYRGMPILSPSTSPNINPSPLSLFRGPLSSKVQKMGVKKMQRRLLEQLDDILTVAAEIEVPALRDDESKEPIERQMLMSPSSERKMTQVRGWFKPTTEDGALTQLLDDSDRVMRQKTDNVIRMRNTIKYSEKVRQEWEERVLKALSQYDEDEERDEDIGDESMVQDEGPFEEDAEEPQSASSTTSEYAFNGEEHTASTASLTTIAPTPESITEVSRASPEQPPLVAPRPHPPAHHARPPNSLHNTRSSTPASVISSPLALVPPIVASPSPPPPMDLNDHAEPELPLDRSTATIRSRRSTPNLQPKLLLTPPMSPVPSPKESTTAQPKRMHRRQSTTASAILSPSNAIVPLSPRFHGPTPVSRAAPTSIKDFDIIKPISKGAFGSVFLAKKKATGDYYAIKVLKKADMIAKNQVTNVKAERMILMTQSESPFVAKLYFTFQSKENLYLVMEYLNGGDCNNLLTALGTLPEEWAKNYIAEVVLGLESLHSRGVVHRDLKPDNLLIDQHGHLKLTDFGLSRIGLLDRQTGISVPPGRPPARLSPQSRPPSIDLAHLHMPSPPSEVIAGGSYFGQQRPQPLQRSGSSPYVCEQSADQTTGDGAAIPARAATKTNDSPLQSFATELTNDLRSHAGGTPPTERKFVGTPDYLAPETILGLRADDTGVDWWALGAITYEFLYGMPPFHDETPEKVFENILAGHVEYHEEMEYSPEAIDFMRRLLTANPAERLGCNGPEEVKAHPWFKGMEWEKITDTEAAFIPQVTDPESTEYFNSRGAMPFMEDEEHIALRPADSPGLSPDPSVQPQVIASAPAAGSSELLPALGDENFGSFSFKNLPVLKQANDEVIKKLRTDQMVPLTHTLSEPSVASQHARRRSVSNRIKKPPSVVTSFDPKTLPTNPPSPATSTSSIASSPSRGSLPPSTPASAGVHARKGSEVGAFERVRDSDGMRRASSGPSRLRTASVSTSHSADGSVSDVASGSVQSQFEVHTPPSSVVSLDFRPEMRPEHRKLELSDLRKSEVGDARKPDPVDLRKKPDPHDRAVTVLLAEDNPITAKIIETLLIRLGCRCVVVADGSEAISVAMGDIHFDVILMDLHMPVLDGEGAARYIKSTNSKNTHSPIIAVSAYSGTDPVEGSSLFAGAIAKPVQKADILAVMRQLGFKTSSAPTPGGRESAATTKVTAVVA